MPRTPANRRLTSSLCCRGYFRIWPDSDLPARPLFRRSWGRSGHQSANAKDTICEYAPYADEYTLFGCFDRLLQQCEGHGLRISVVQGGADEADAIARRL